MPRLSPEQHQKTSRGYIKRNKTDKIVKLFENTAMKMTEKFFSFFKPERPTFSLAIDPISCNMMKGLFIFVALSGTSAYYALKFANFCSTLPQIKLKTVPSISYANHTNTTDISDNFEKIKNFIDWFNDLEPYDICFYSAFGTASCLALIFSMAATSLFMLSHMELKKKPKVEHDDHGYSALLSPSKKVNSQPRLNLSNLSFDT